MDKIPALLIPDGMQAAALAGGSEIIIEERSGGAGTARRFLHIFDEFERREKVAGGPAAGASPDELRVHGQRLRELDWARATLWSDEGLQGYLGNSDPLLWPDLDAVRRAADLARQLRQYGGPQPDPRGAESLARAVAILDRETRHCGVHPLKDAPVAGRLTAYSVEQWLRSPGAVAGVSLPDSLVLATADRPLEPAAWQVELSAPVLLPPDALRLPATQRTLGRLVELVIPPGAAATCTADVKSQWLALVATHSGSLDGGRVPLAGGVLDAVSVFAADEVVVARLMQRAASAGDARVRLRMGVFVTVVHRHTLFLACGKPPRSTLTDAEAAAFERFTGLPFAALASEGTARLQERRLSAEAVVAAAHEMFLGPVSSAEAGGPSGFAVEELGPLDSAAGTVLFKLTATHNPFVIAHGPRVSSGFSGNAECLGFLKRDRDEAMERHADATRREDFQEAFQDASRPAGAGGSAHSPSQGLRGEALHIAVGQSLVSALAAGPMTKRELSGCNALAPYARGPDFERVLKEALRTHTTLQGRKYSLLS